LNPHFHAVFLDGVYRPAARDGPVFVALPRLSTSDVADVLPTVPVRIVRYLVRMGAVEAGPHPICSEADAAPCARAPAPRAPPRPRAAGPRAPPRPPSPLRGRPGVVITAPLAAAEVGFSPHAATHAGAHDPRAREALVKYPLRPPLADEHVRLLPD